MSQATQSIYNFTQEVFTYNEQHYNVVLTPVLYAEEDGLDFTGDYTGILINPSSGTIPFQLTADRDKKWQMEILTTYNPAVFEELEFDPINGGGQMEEVTREMPGINDQGIIDELDRIIQKSLMSTYV